MLFETPESRAVESRSRMISFRVTAEEYARFRELCIARNLRNVSEVVRLAVNHLLAETTVAPTSDTRPIAIRVETIESRLNDLAHAVADIEDRLLSLPPAALDRFASAS